MSNVANGAGTKPMNGTKGRRLAIVLTVVFVVALFLVAAPLFIVFMAGMVPTAVAFFCDRDRYKYSAIAIGSGNLAGVVPFLVSLAIDGPTLNRASEVVTDVFSIAIMYGGAGAGWLAVTMLPTVVSVYMNVTTEARIQRERKTQQKLIEDWGAEIAADEHAVPGVSEFRKTVAR